MFGSYLPHPQAMITSVKAASRLSPLIGIKGYEATRSSMYTKIPKQIRPRTRMNEMYDFCQPTIGASLKAKLIKTRPATPVRAPGRSNLTHHFGLGPVLNAGGVRLLSAGTMNKLSMLISAQVTARAQKDHCHQPFSAQREEKAEPMTIPTGPMPPKHEIEKLRFSPIENVRPIKARPFGIRRAGPKPCIALPPTSMVKPR